jgi:hypothetical protein
VACPFFMPIEKLENGSWPHVHRLPLGCGWSGQCMAPGHEGETPSGQELSELCNLGYAGGCGRLPQDRAWDSVRFGARISGAEQDEKQNREHNREHHRMTRVQVRYVCERDHHPAEHGILEFDALLNECAKPHPDTRVQRLAECFLSVYLEKRKTEAQPIAS